MLQGEEIITRILVLAMICLGAFSGCCSRGIDIRVKRILSTNLARYHTAKISVQDEDYKTYVEKTSDSSSEIDRSYIGSELFSILFRSGISTSYGKTDTVDLKVECLFKRRIGCAEIGRHLDIEFKHISFVNLKFIDAKTDEIIGEVECKRPFWKSLPAGFIKLMFDELIKSQGGKDEKRKP